MAYQYSTKLSNLVQSWSRQNSRPFHPRETCDETGQRRRDNVVESLPGSLLWTPLTAAGHWRHNRQSIRTSLPINAVRRKVKKEGECTISIFLCYTWSHRELFECLPTLVIRWNDSTSRRQNKHDTKLLRQTKQYGAQHLIPLFLNKQCSLGSLRKLIRNIDVIPKILIDAWLQAVVAYALHALDSGERDLELVWLDQQDNLKNTMCDNVSLLMFCVWIILLKLSEILVVVAELSKMCNISAIISNCKYSMLCNK